MIPKVDISDDLKANFRSWEKDCDNKEDATTLTYELMSRHRISFKEAYGWACHWVGYEPTEEDEE